MDWHPRGNVIVVGSADGTCWMWNSKGNCLNIFSGHDGAVTCGKFTSDGKLLVTGGKDQSLRIWVPTKGTAQHTVTGDLFHCAPVICFDTKDSVIISGGENGTLRMTNINSGKILSSYEDHEDSVESIQIYPNLPIFSTASLDGTLKMWDLGNGKLRSTVMAHEGGVTQTRVHPTEPLIFSCGVDGTIKVWDIRQSTCIRNFQGHTKPVLDMSLSKDGKTVLTSSDDNTARIFQWQ